MAGFRYESLPLIPFAQYPVPYTRLLLLKPGNPDDPLICTLETCNAENAPRYEALSYVWGKRMAEAPMSCNGMQILITANLDEALRSLRFPNMARRLWVDAICIDQQNIDERTRQVSYMRLIYVNTARVIAWIGQESPESKEAFEFAETLSNLPNSPSGADFWNAGEFPLDEIFPDLPDEKTREEAKWRALDCLADTFHREYFRRSWCIQEVVVAAQCLCKCGDLEIDFFALISWALLALGATSQKYPGTTPINFWIGLHITRGRQGLSPVPGVMSDLLELLTISRDFAATDPRDKVFSLLGISVEGLAPVTVLKRVATRTENRLITKMHRSSNSLVTAINAVSHVISPNVDFARYPALQPDYSKTLVDVYTETAQLLLQTPQFVLDVLSQVDHQEDPSGSSFPSWVPLWFQPRAVDVIENHPYSAGQCSRDAAHCNANCGKHHPITGTTSPKTFAILHDKPPRGIPAVPNSLILDGYVVDHVAAVSDIVPAGRGRHPHYRANWSQVLDASPLSAHGQRYRDGTPLTAAFLMNLEAMPPSALASPALQHAARPSLPPDPTDADFRKAHAGMHASGHQAVDLSYEAIAGGRPEVAMRAMRIAGNRRVYRTRKGYLGLGPRVMQAGDEICVLLGGRVPYVLRADGPHRFFLGEAYVHDDEVISGRMTDEVMAGRGEARLCKFVIC